MISKKEALQKTRSEQVQALKKKLNATTTNITSIPYDRNTYTISNTVTGFVAPQNGLINQSYDWNTTTIGYAACPLCGCAVVNMETHETWHDSMQWEANRKAKLELQEMIEEIIGLSA
jgi:hypothetical protein